MRKFFLATFLAAFVAWIYPQHEAEAFEPVTMSLLAPMALEAASAATPYIIKWLGGVGRVFFKMGKDMLEVFLLPIGIFEIIFGTPFSTACFKEGARFMFKGAIAPFKLCFHSLLLPLAFFGMSFH